MAPCPLEESIEPAAVADGFFCFMTKSKPAWPALKRKVCAAAHLFFGHNASTTFRK